MFEEIKVKTEDVAFTRESFNDMVEQITGFRQIPDDEYETILKRSSLLLNTSVFLAKQEVEKRKDDLWLLAVMSNFIATYQCPSGHHTFWFTTNGELLNEYCCGCSDECGKNVVFLGDYRGQESVNLDNWQRYEDWCKEDDKFKALKLVEKTIAGAQNALFIEAASHHSGRQPKSIKYPNADKIPVPTLIMNQQEFDDTYGKKDVMEK